MEENRKPVGLVTDYETGEITNELYEGDQPNVMVKAITVNPYVFCRGSKVNKTILGLFENSKWGENDITE